MFSMFKRIKNTNGANSSSDIATIYQSLAAEILQKIPNERESRSDLAK